MSRDFHEAVRADKVEIRGVRFIATAKRGSAESQAWHAVHERWLDLSQRVRRLHNFVWRFWISWHTVLGHGQSV